MRRWPLLGLAVLAMASSITYAIFSDKSANVIYVTWDSLEPDKWSSVWLIKNHIDPQASVEVRPTGDPLIGGIAFGVPDAQFKRSGNTSTFESLLDGYGITDPQLRKLGKLITAIETTAWASASDPYVQTVEQNFRYLQDRYRRAYVPIECYATFFDTLYLSLSDSSLTPASLNQQLNDAVAKQSCDEGAVIAQRSTAKRVQEVPIERVLSEIALGKKVVFVDTREPEEFNKSHIPGAINIPMRDLDNDAYESLKEADLVISYCVKDFRGYEVARLMLENGVPNASVMKPFGLSGWQSLSLPLTTQDTGKEESQEALQRCAKDQTTCMTVSS